MSLQLQTLAFPLLRTKTRKSNANRSAFLSPSWVGVECHDVFLGEKGKKSTMKKQAVKCRQSDYVEQQRFNDYTATETSGVSPLRVFVGHTIYKGKAALTVQPRSPEFVCLDSGAFKLSKEGSVLLDFAPSAGVRQYDWSRKQVFSLSVTEIGKLVSLGPTTSCEFFHDPYKGKSDEGKVRKVLKIEPLADGSGHFFNLSVQNKLLNVDESIHIPVTRAELAVLVSAFNFILPYLMGWHAFANSTKLEDANHTNNATPRYGGDYDWNSGPCLLVIFYGTDPVELHHFVNAAFSLTRSMMWQSFIGSRQEKLEAAIFPYGQFVWRGGRKFLPCNFKKLEECSF